jgi:nitrous oxidase accessory protein
VRVFLSIALLFIISSVSAGTIVVGKDRQVSSLRQGIAMAKPGDTVFLLSGNYKEGNIVITKPIHLIGIGEAVLDGEFRNEILTISGRDIVIRRIHFANAGYSSMNDFAAIKIIDAVNILVEQNTISNASFAIHVANTTHSTIKNNRIRGTNKSEHLSGNGIHLWKCTNMLILNNSVSGHRDGIYLEFVTFSTIQGNNSEKNIRYGLHFMFSNDDVYRANVFRSNGAGVAVMYSRDVTMESNHFEENWGAAAYGILLKEIKGGSVSNNIFLKNTVGIFMEGSSRMQIQKNTFRNNGWAIKVQASCDDNNFNNNNFAANSFDVASNGSVSLNQFSNNYWDKYEGYDINRDGIGDVPYHPVSLYSMIVEQNPTTVMLMRSFMVALLDRAEKAIPGLTPQNLVDKQPRIKPNKL